VNRSTLLLIVANVAMTSFAQIVLKAGMGAPDVVRALAAEARLPAMLTVLLHPWIVVGLSLYAGAALVWLLVLSKVEVSLAYPFVGLGFVVTMGLAWAFLGEAISVGRVTGTLMIAAGIVVLAKT
jgi:drug/metabolite transporter (DMT)-like permease